MNTMCILTLEIPCAQPYQQSTVRLKECRCDLSLRALGLHHFDQVSLDHLHQADLGVHGQRVQSSKRNGEC